MIDGFRDKRVSTSGSAATWSTTGLILAFVCLGQYVVFGDVPILNLVLPSF